jgi:hypothetical protein
MHNTRNVADTRSSDRSSQIDHRPISQPHGDKSEPNEKKQHFKIGIFEKDLASEKEDYTDDQTRNQDEIDHSFTSHRFSCKTTGVQEE